MAISGGHMFNLSLYRDKMKILSITTMPRALIFGM